MRDIATTWTIVEGPLTPDELQAFMYNVGMMMRHVLSVCEVDEGLAVEVNEVSVLPKGR
jgi:hypothetical protein